MVRKEVLPGWEMQSVIGSAVRWRPCWGVLQGRGHSQMSCPGTAWSRLRWKPTMTKATCQAPPLVLNFWEGLIWKFGSNSVFNLSTIALHLLLKIIQYENLQAFHRDPESHVVYPSLVHKHGGSCVCKIRTRPRRFSVSGLGSERRAPETSLKWLRIHLPAQGTWVPSLV